jgi:hypothetical protein
VWDLVRTALVEFIQAQQECALGSDSVDGDALVAREQRRQKKTALRAWDEEEMRRDILAASSMA